MTTRQIWEIDDYNRIIDGTTKALLFTVDTSSDDDPLPIMRKIAAAPALYVALQIMVKAANVDEIDPLVMFASIERAKEALAQAEGTNR